ncbi:hypothetical protein DLM46_26190 [Paraburkholderia lacunae]|uniref:Extensin n=1 Tax=Paraburkholderia lacunae TaxID=2211104 RepID=A0A370N2V4_9BURK|nr:hypothetical protein DLM46_26190 [Paraburkholderia lacunae]
MTNTGKVLITGVLLVELGFASYLLFPKGDKATAEADAGMNSPPIVAGVESRSGSDQVTAGSVVSATPPGKGTNGIVAAPRPQPQPQPSPVAKAAPEPAPAARIVATEQKPSTASGQQPTAAPTPAPTLKPTPAPTLASANAQQSFSSKASSAPRSERGRDGLSRNGSNPVASAITDQLVRESAKLDPALPPPPNQPVVRDDPRRSSSNPVAAAMTDALVKQSAKLDPALPPPQPQSPSRPATQ